MSNEGPLAFCDSGHDSGHDSSASTGHTLRLSEPPTEAHVLDNFTNGPPPRDRRPKPAQNHRLGTKGPYVINLGVSSTPFQMPATPPATLERDWSSRAGTTEARKR